MRQRIASTISNVFNPFLLGFVVIVLFSFKDTSSTGEAIKWAAISLAVSVIPVLGIVIYMVRQRKLEGVFVNPREQRYRVYLISSVLGAIGFAVMWWCEAPNLLRLTFLAGLIAIFVFMVVNFFWKISLHTAFMSASAMVLTLAYGAAGAFSFLALPAVMWSRVELKQHSVAQVTAGAICAAVIVLIAFI